MFFRSFVLCAFRRIIIAYKKPKTVSKYYPDKLPGITLCSR